MTLRQPFQCIDFSIMRNRLLDIAKSACRFVGIERWLFIDIKTQKVCESEYIPNKSLR